MFSKFNNLHPSIAHTIDKLMMMKMMMVTKMKMCSEDNSHNTTIFDRKKGNATLAEYGIYLLDQLFLFAPPAHTHASRGDEDMFAHLPQSRDHPNIKKPCSLLCSSPPLLLPKSPLTHSIVPTTTTTTNY